jgi:hypothetical protein
VGISEADQRYPIQILLTIKGTFTIIHYIGNEIVVCICISFTFEKIPSYVVILSNTLLEESRKLRGL